MSTCFYQIDIRPPEFASSVRRRLATFVWQATKQTRQAHERER